MRRRFDSGPSRLTFALFADSPHFGTQHVNQRQPCTGKRSFRRTSDHDPAVGHCPVRGRGGLARRRRRRRFAKHRQSAGLSARHSAELAGDAGDGNRGGRRRRHGGLAVAKAQVRSGGHLEGGAVAPEVLAPTAADLDQGNNEFEVFRNTQAELLKHRFVLTAALRNPKLKNLACIQREDARHNTISWLTSTVQVELGKGSGIMKIAAALPDPQEATTIVNAVVEAYMEEVVNYDRQQRRERLDSLQRISGEKEAEVSSKRRELEHLGVGDDQTAVARGQAAVMQFAEYQRELQRMRWERTALAARLDEAMKMKESLAGADISEVEVAMLLNNDPLYRELTARVQNLNQFTNLNCAANQGKAVARLRTGRDRVGGEHEAGREPGENGPRAGPRFQTRGFGKRDPPHGNRLADRHRSGEQFSEGSRQQAG